MLSPRAWYLASRGISTFASLGLALIYSYDLGQVNRAVLAVIMTTNALLWIVTTSGSTLTLRKIGWLNLGKHLYNSFLSLAIIQLLVVLAVFLIVTYFYSSYKNRIPGNLLLIAVVYVCLSGLHLIVMEALISYSKFRLGAFFDVSTIIIQFMLYLFILPLGNYSAAAKVSEFWLVLPTILNIVFYPILINLRSLNYNKYKRFLGAVIICCFCFGIIFSFIVTHFSENIISLLFGNKYNLAGEYLSLYIWSTLPYFTLFILSNVIYLENLIRKNLVISFVSILVVCFS